MNYKNRILIYLNSNSKIQNPISRCYPLVRDCLNESSNESGCVDESRHEVDAARVWDEVADISFTVCPLAKQTRIPFSTSQISSTALFALLHVDI